MSHKYTKPSETAKRIQFIEFIRVCAVWPIQEDALEGNASFFIALRNVRTGITLQMMIKELSTGSPCQMNVMCQACPEAPSRTWQNVHHHTIRFHNPYNFL